MFFVQCAQNSLILTRCNSHCQRTKWLPWPVKSRIGMSWRNAGRGLGPSWLMAAQTGWDLRSRVCFTCGWDAGPPEPGSNCGLNLDATSRMKTSPLLFLTLVLAARRICLSLALSHLRQENFYISIHVYPPFLVAPLLFCPRFSSLLVESTSSVTQCFRGTRVPCFSNDKETRKVV